MSAYKPYLKLHPRSRRKIRASKTLDGEYFFSEDVAGSPCEAAFYIVPHKSEPMFKVGWGVAADRRLDKINDIWGKRLDIYSAVVIATSREAAINAERTMKLILDRRGWKLDGLPPLEGHSEFFSTGGLLYAYETCMQQLLPTMHALEERTHVITARGADQTAREMFEDIAKKREGTSVSADQLLLSMIPSGLRPADIPRILGALTWNDFPKSVIASLSDALRSTFSAYAPYANALWTKFGGEILNQPKRFLQLVSPYASNGEQKLLDLLDFIKSRGVTINAQSAEWLTQISAALSPRKMLEFTASNQIDLRTLSFAQRTQVFKKLLEAGDQAALLELLPYQIDDLEQLRAEAAERRRLASNFSKIDHLLYNLNHINNGNTPKNFPGVLATLYLNHFDGLTEETIIRPPQWPTHEQIHLNTLTLALRGLSASTNDKRHSFLLRPGPVFQKAIITAMLDLYTSCLEKHEADSIDVMEKLADINHAHLAGYFDRPGSTAFADIRGELRQAYQDLLAIKNGAPLAQNEAALQTRIKALEMPLRLCEEGRYYAMYAFREIVYEFGDFITAPPTPVEPQRQLLVLQYIRGLWSLVHQEIIHHQHIFNTNLLYLHSWSSVYELENLPPPHPQAVL